MFWKNVYILSVISILSKSQVALVDVLIKSLFSNHLAASKIKVSGGIELYDSMTSCAVEGWGVATVLEDASSLMAHISEC